MGFLSQGVPKLVPWLIFRAWRGGRWDFRLWPFLGRFFGFCTEKLRFFGFDVRCSFWFFGFLAPAFLAKIKHVTDFSLCCESVQSDVKLFLCFYFTVNPGQIAMWDSGFLFEVYSSLCQALGQCRWAKKANEKRKKHESSENKVNLSLPSFKFTRFSHFYSIRLVFPSTDLGAWNRLGLQLLRAFCELKIAPIVLYCYPIEDLCEFS